MSPPIRHMFAVSGIGQSTPSAQFGPGTASEFQWMEWTTGRSRAANASRMALKAFKCISCVTFGKRQHQSFFTYVTFHVL